MRIRIDHPGETGIDVRAPKVDGWECFFVGRVGGEYTTFSYRPVDTAVVVDGNVRFDMPPEVLDAIDRGVWEEA